MCTNHVDRVTNFTISSRAYSSNRSSPGTSSTDTSPDISKANPTKSALWCFVSFIPAPLIVSGDDRVSKMVITFSASGSHEDTRRKLCVQCCSFLRCRIRDVATAAISGRWTEIQPFYPRVCIDADNDVWKELCQEQKVLMEKVGAIKRSSDPTRKSIILDSLRAEYPGIARIYPKPSEASQAVDERTSPLAQRELDPLPPYQAIGKGADEKR